MEFELKYTIETKEDFNTATAFYKNLSDIAGNRFYKQIDRTLKRITQYPLAYPIVYEDIRKAIIPRYPYIILFVVENDQVVVLSIRNVTITPLSAGRSKKPRNRY